MRAIVIRSHGGPEVLGLEEVPDPVPGPDEVVIDVRACALNHLDLWVRRGLPGAPFHLPIIGGGDISGDVAAVGAGADDLAVGTPVMVLPGLSCGACRRCDEGQDPLCEDYGILGETRDGGLAEKVVVPRRNVFPKPGRLSYEQAAAGSLSFLTAWHMLASRAQLQAGEWVLVHGGASGVGSAAIQIATHLGATVIATAGSEAKLAAARKLGASHAVDYGQTDWVREVKAITERRGVDVVFEHVGGEVFEGSLRCLAWAGRLVTCGATAGSQVAIDLRHLFFKSQSILGSTMGSRSEFASVVDLLGNGSLEPVVGLVLPLEKIAEAHAALEAREVIGKVVIIP